MIIEKRDTDNYYNEADYALYGSAGMVCSNVQAARKSRFTDCADHYSIRVIPPVWSIEAW